MRRKVALEAPRGFSKSTLTSFLLPIHGICLNRYHFIALISNTHDQAVKFLQAIKYEFETNAKLKEYYPGLVPNKAKWSDNDIEFYRDGRLAHKIVALGVGAKLRGLKFLQHRPDLFLIDDGEDDEMVRSDLRREYYQWWLDHVVLMTNPLADVFMIGTAIHEEALLHRIVRKKKNEDRVQYGDWETGIFKALANEHTPQEHSNWPEHQSTEALQKERARDPYGFSQEKQNEPVDPKYCPFKEEYFRDRLWWTQLPTQLSISICIDPAWTTKDYSKETAIVVAGWDTQRRLWILDYHHGKYDDPSVTIKLVLDWYLRWKANAEVHPAQTFDCIGFDTVSAQKMLMIAFRDQCKIRGLHPYLKELKADRDKIRRIWGLEPLFRENRIFLRPDMVVLQNQLKGFPRNVQGGLCDVADATAYFMQLQHFIPMATHVDPESDPANPDTWKITFKDYVQLHEDVGAFKRRYPGTSRWDPALLQAMVRTN